MTFVRKHSGDRTKAIVATYTCPEHGEFDAEVQRDERGEAPDTVMCGLASDWRYTPGGSVPLSEPCGLRATWTPSPSVACRVRRVEVTRGKYERPERKTFLDTRNLGEGQDPEEFQAARRKMWRDVRMDKARKEFLSK